MRSTIEFLHINSNKNRNYVIKAMSRGSKSNYSVLKYYARFIANLNPYFKDFTQDIISNLLEEFNLLIRQDKVTNLDERIKNIRFICELIKFDLFPVQNIFDILKRIIEDFKGYSVDILCAIFENAGRYLYLNDNTHLKFNSFIENIKQMTFHKLSYDERAYNSVVSCLSICKPNENLMKKAFKVRSVEETYIRFLLFQLLTKEKVNKIAVLLRRLDWATQENTIFKISICCNLIALLKETHPDFVHNLVDALFEELRVSFEHKDFNDNQHKILISLVFAYFYINSIIDSNLIFEILYFILIYSPDWEVGKRELVGDNLLDSPRDIVRILMIVALLDNCGSTIKERYGKEKLQEFVHFFQIYILSKYYIPLDTENLILNCLENLFPHIKIYNDFTNALKDSKNFQGFDFEVESAEEQGEKTTDTTNSKPNLKNMAKEIENDEVEFKRKKENVKPENYNINIDEEIQKIINESMAKNKGSRVNTVINPFNDLKKKTINKTASSPSKMKLITKHQNKVVVKEINKN